MPNVDLTVPKFGEEPAANPREGQRLRRAGIQSDCDLPAAESSPWPHSFWACPWAVTT